MQGFMRGGGGGGGDLRSQFSPFNHNAHKPSEFGRL